MKRSEAKNTLTKEAPKGQKLGIKCSENEQSSTVLWNINNHQPPSHPCCCAAYLTDDDYGPTQFYSRNLELRVTSPGVCVCVRLIMYDVCQVSIISQLYLTICIWPTTPAPAQTGLCFMIDINQNLGILPKPANLIF